MFEEFDRRKLQFGAIAKKLFYIFSAALLLFLGIAILFLLSWIPSHREKEARREIAEKERSVLDSVDFAAKEMGFVRRSVGNYDVYVPSLTIFVGNRSPKTIEDISLRAYFRSGDSFFCQGYARIFYIQAGEITEASLRCTEPTVFGTVVNGIRLWQTTNPVEYEVHAYLAGVQVVPIKGKTIFKVF
jgi:hypothetical protein